MPEEGDGGEGGPGEAAIKAILSLAWSRISDFLLPSLKELKGKVGRLAESYRNILEEVRTLVAAVERVKLEREKDKTASEQRVGELRLEHEKALNHEVSKLSKALNHEVSKLSKEIGHLKEKVAQLDGKVEGLHRND